jgi:predicted nucleotidyltransferase
MDRRVSAPLVTRDALEAFTQRLAGQFAPEQIILFGSMARGEARWDSDADLLVVMPYEGEPREMVEALLAAGKADFPVDLHLRRPEEIGPRDASTPVRNPVVLEWIERAERHWRRAELLLDLPPGYLSGLFQVQRCLETYLRAALIAQDIPSRKCRDLLILSNRLAGTIPGRQPDPATLNTLTQAAQAYLDPGEGDPEPTKDTP